MSRLHMQDCYNVLSAVLYNTYNLFCIFYTVTEGTACNVPLAITSYPEGVLRHDSPIVADVANRIPVGKASWKTSRRVVWFTPPYTRFYQSSRRISGLSILVLIDRVEFSQVQAMSVIFCEAQLLRWVWAKRLHSDKWVEKHDKTLTYEAFRLTSSMYHLFHSYCGLGVYFSCCSSINSSISLLKYSLRYSIYGILSLVSSSKETINSACVYVSVYAVLCNDLASFYVGSNFHTLNLNDSYAQWHCCTGGLYSLCCCFVNPLTIHLALNLTPSHVWC